jgi:hypothetical protein
MNIRFSIHQDFVPLRLVQGYIQQSGSYVGAMGGKGDSLVCEFDSSS